MANRPPRERILSTALDLFYRQGYGATGINQILAEADAARASFYDHFRSKEDLLLAYALELSRKDIADVRAAVEALPTPRDRFFAPLDMLPKWLEESDYRGCPFQNMMAEVPPGAKRVKEVARQHLEASRAIYRELAVGLKHSEPEYAHIDPDEIAAKYVVVFEGAIAAAVAYRDTRPIASARAALEACLAQSER